MLKHYFIYLYYNQTFKATNSFFLLILFVPSLFQVGVQVWWHDSGGSDFERKYKISHIHGKGNKFPYQKPFIITSQEYYLICIYY